MAYRSENGIYKTQRGSMVGGVCAGLSEYFRIDVTIIRIIAIVLVFGWGAGLVLYLALWLLLPER